MTNPQDTRSILKEAYNELGHMLMKGRDSDSEIHEFLNDLITRVQEDMKQKCLAAIEEQAKIPNNLMDMEEGRVEALYLRSARTAIESVPTN